MTGIRFLFCAVITSYYHWIFKKIFLRKEYGCVDLNFLPPGWREVGEDWEVPSFRFKGKALNRKTLLLLLLSFFLCIFSLSYCYCCSTCMEIPCIKEVQLSNSFWCFGKASLSGPLLDQFKGPCVFKPLYMTIRLSISRSTFLIR